VVDEGERDEEARDSQTEGLDPVANMSAPAMLAAAKAVTASGG